MFSLRNIVCTSAFCLPLAAARKWGRHELLNTAPVSPATASQQTSGATSLSARVSQHDTSFVPTADRQNASPHWRLSLLRKHLLILWCCVLLFLFCFGVFFTSQTCMHLLNRTHTVALVRYPLRLGPLKEAGGDTASPARTDNISSSLNPAEVSGSLPTGISEIIKLNLSSELRH